MKLSEMIEKLQELQKEFGDKEINVACDARYLEIRGIGAEQEYGEDLVISVPCCGS